MIICTNDTLLQATHKRALIQSGVSQLSWQLWHTMLDNILNAWNKTKSLSSAHRRLKVKLSCLPSQWHNPREESNENVGVDAPLVCFVDDDDRVLGEQEVLAKSRRRPYQNPCHVTMLCMALVAANALYLHCSLWQLPSFCNVIQS